ncbi:MAG: RHS repeat-associated core domain-containing protein [Chloroflexi bacterium]|nr:RHS repeat-associated core domain-containing protein [Chloroflexota bacterium]
MMMPQSMSLIYLLSDHLGSTSLTTDKAGVKVSEMRYKPCPTGVLRKGEVRYSWTAGLSTTPGYKLSSYTFTGQFSYMDDPTTSGVTEGFGLMFYNARFYDPALGRFSSPDTIIPGGVQGYDRYAYVNNNPIRYNDPTGHMCSDPEDPTPSCENGRTPPPNNGGGGGGNGGGGGGGGGDDDEGKDETDPDLCRMYGEGCGGGGSGKSLYSPVKNRPCDFFTNNGYYCTFDNLTQENLTGFQDLRTNYRILVRILYYGGSVGAAALTTKNIGVAILVGILAIVGDEYLVQPGLRDVDRIYMQFENAAVNGGEINIGRAPGSDSRLVGSPDNYIEVNTMIGKSFVDLMMGIKKYGAYLDN